MPCLLKTEIHPNYLCREVPGHSACQKKIGKGRCPSRDGTIDTTACHGHSHNPHAKLPQAMQWLKEEKDALAPVQSLGFAPSSFFDTRVRP